MSPRIAIACSTPWFWRIWDETSETEDWVVLRVDGPAGLDVHELAEFSPDIVFFPHWSHIVGPEVFETYECIVFHTGRLPQGRGGSPIQNQIVRGQELSELCALRMGAELDAGPVYVRRTIPLTGSAEEIYIRLGRHIASLIVEIVRERPTPTPQVGPSTTFRRRKPDQSDMAGASLSSLLQVHDFIRMLDAPGYPHAFVNVGPFRLRLTRSSLRMDSVLADVEITLRRGDDE